MMLPRMAVVGVGGGSVW